MPRIDPKLLPSIGDRKTPGILPVDRGGTGSDTGSSTGTGDLVLQTSPTIITPVVQGLLDLTGTGSGQIKFPATENPSSNKNTLDDYEEDTWVPTFSGLTVVGAPAHTGTYTKIGRLVFYQIIIAAATSVATVASTTFCDNFPFVLLGGFSPCVMSSEDQTKTAIGLGGGSGGMTISLGTMTATPKINVSGFVLTST